MKRLWFFLLVMCISTPALADSITLGVGMQKGHSYSGRYGIEDGYSSVASYQKYRSLNRYFKLGYGLTLMDTYFTVKHNDEGKGNHSSESREYMMTMQVDGSVYLDYFKRVKPFLRLGGGMEWSTDEGWLPVYTPSFGVDILCTKSLSIVVMSTHIYDSERRQAVETIGLKYTF